MQKPLCRYMLSIVLLACACAGMAATPSPDASLTSASGTARLGAEHWIAQLRRPDRVLLDVGAVAALDRALLAQEPALYDLDALPQSLEAEQVRARVEAQSFARASRPRA
ncbi:hypothetical protein BH23PSE2_BH23PSE2_03540 [soil metagenome]